MFDNEFFDLTADHLKLIQRMNVGYNEYCEFGAPDIDPKRPYGNSSVYYDIGEILQIEPTDGDPEAPEYSEEQEAQMLKIHKETAKALQVILYSQSFVVGKYKSEPYRDNWKLVS